MKSKYEKFTGELLSISEIRIGKTSKKVTYNFWSLPVLLSSDTCIAVERYGKLQIYNRKKERYSSNENVGHVHCTQTNWRSSSFEDEIISRSVSFYSKKINDRKAQKALTTFLNKEFSFFSGIIGTISETLKELMK